ncbi:MAG: hypothetical protein U1F43_26965 [Myxococcota bacterium]
MASHFGAHSAASGLAQELVDDASPSIHLWAASFLRDVATIAQVASNAPHAAELRATAVRELGPYPSAPETVAVVDQLLADRDGPALAHALVEPLGAVPHPGAEAALLASLTSASEAEVKLAVRRLGAIATRRAVTTLRSLAAARPACARSLARPSARSRRVSRAPPGGLARTASEVGRLSLR